MPFKSCTTRLAQTRATKSKSFYSGILQYNTIQLVGTRNKHACQQYKL